MVEDVTTDRARGARPRRRYRTAGSERADTDLEDALPGQGDDVAPIGLEGAMPRPGEPARTDPPSVDTGRRPGIDPTRRSPEEPPATPWRTCSQRSGSRS